MAGHRKTHSRIRAFAVLASISTLLILGSAGEAVAQKGRGEAIRLRADIWCPYTCEPNSSHPGLLVEVAQRAFAPLGLLIDYQTADRWDLALDGLFVGDTTVALGTTPLEALGAIHPASPLLISNTLLVGRKNAPRRWTPGSSLQGLIIGVVDGYDLGERAELMLNGVPAKDLRRATGWEPSQNLMQMLMQGQIDAYFEDEQVMAWYRKELAAEAVLDTWLRLPGDLPVGIAISPIHPEAQRLADLWDETLASLRVTGEIRAFKGRYGITSSPQ